MQCRKARRLISLRLDGRLSARDASALDAHVAACVGCRDAAGQLQRAWDALRAVDEVVPAPDDWARIEAAAGERSRSWRWPWVGWDLMPAPAAVGLLLIAMVALGATGGALLTRAALSPNRAAPIEARMLAATVGELPSGSPMSGVFAVVGADLVEEKRP
jgi:predicted anti-sigma-YlaC factor YlaD